MFTSCIDGLNVHFERRLVEICIEVMDEVRCRSSIANLQI